jgi:hypothetical protein
MTLLTTDLGGDTSFEKPKVWVGAELKDMLVLGTRVGAGVAETGRFVRGRLELEVGVEETLELEDGTVDGDSAERSF